MNGATSLSARPLVLALALPLALVPASSLSACAAAPRATPSARPVVPLPARVALAVLAEPPVERASAAATRALARLTTALAEALLERGVDVVVQVPHGTAPLTETTALTFASGIDVDAILVVLLQRASVVERVHHVHRYHDAAVSAWGRLIALPSGTLVAEAAGDAAAARRARHAPPLAAVDLAAERVALRIARQLHATAPTLPRP